MLAKVMSPFWTVFAATALSLAWLLPNHSIPWLGFHGDAWAAAMLAIVGAWVLWRNQFSADWHGLTLMMATTATIPLLQYAAGMIPLFGVAWINTVYVLGFLLALIVGAAWERQTPGQGSDYLLLAIGLASIASVGMQFNQILNLDSLGPWTMASTGGRHFANMAQPNQLASLLLLGVLACGWGFQRRVLWPRTATWIAAFLLFGVAMTGSRTGFLNVALLVVSTMIWRRVGPSPKFLQVVLGLGVFFVASAFLVPVLNDLFWDGASPFGRPASGDPRWTAWVMFMKAALHQPLLGFGWGQLAYAQFLMLDERIALGGSFLQAHNVILDLILWNGIPIGLAIAAFLAWWFWTMVRHINSFQQWVLLSFLMVLGVHAMLEYPLQYAYFLLPAGLVMGCLNAPPCRRTACRAPRQWRNRP